MIARTLFILLIAAASACAKGSSSVAEGTAQPTPSAPVTPCRSVEASPPNAPSQQQTFAGQTRACAMSTTTPLDLVVVARGLNRPWAVEPLPGGDLLVTEKHGRMRIISTNGTVGEPIAGVPEVDSGGQGGLLDVALSPAFASDRTIFWSYTEPRRGGNATSLARAELTADRRRLDNVRVIFRAMPTYNGSLHFGSRIAFGRDGMLYLTLGERSDRNMRPQAQQLDSHMGKIVRIRPDGTTPPDNPFVNRDGALPQIWTLGHRNIQSAVFDAQGQLWEIEHGPKGGDELNLVEKGKNYGWPLVSFGEEYSGAAIAGAVTRRAGYVDPVYYWDPVIAPSGAEVYSGDLFPEWRGNLFVGGLRGYLVRLRIENNRVTGEERLLADRGERIRDVRQSPDGALYLVTDSSNGEVWKLVPGR